jgi:leader peptidase (prepilin peptidase)/N-methyltransferase
VDLGGTRVFPEWTWIVGFFIGAAIGSFLNVVVYRMPRGLSLAKPEYSYCPSCEHRLGVPDLVPLFSWLFLRGKCRHCKSPISPRYMVVELINASLWGAVWYQHLVLASDPATAIAYALFASALVAAIFTDLAVYIIPDQINAVMLVVGLAYNGVLLWQGRPEAYTWGIPSAVAGALVGVGVLWGIALLGRLLFRKDAMGHGDIKMARGIGAVLFPFAAVASFGLAVVLGALIGAAIVIVRRAGGFGIDEDEVEEDDEPYEPESVGSLFKCGLGYLLAIDVVGLFAPKLYEKWFGENPYATEDLEEDFQVDLTMIPFGPYLAAGALVALLARDQLASLVDQYLELFNAPPTVWNIRS